MTDIPRERKPTQDEIDSWAMAHQVSPNARVITPVDRSPRPGREYDGDYYLRGRETGKSLYENYRWLPELTLPMCKRIVEYLGIRAEETINDFGCARGYSVRALRLLGYQAFGQDISEWAIANAAEDVQRFLTLSSEPRRCDWTIAKDVMEHLDVSTLELALRAMAARSRKGVFLIVPLGNGHGCYVIPDYERDVTHRQREDLATWYGMLHESLQEPEHWEILTAYRVCGIKDNWSTYARGNGFLLARRLG